LVSVAIVEPSAGRYADCALHPLHKECLLKSFVSKDGSREISNRCPTCRREVFQQIRQPTALNPDNFLTALLDDSDEDDEDDEDDNDEEYDAEVDASVGYNQYLTTGLNQSPKQSIQILRLIL
jgi:predicted  nucleic acid-binding Zn-ribbon protein